MSKSLMLKEVRETGWIAVLGLVVHLANVALCAGYHFLPYWNSTNLGIPFIDGSFEFNFSCISIALSIALGLRQTVGESRGSTWLYLLHRPMSIRRVLAAKLAVGAALYLGCGLVAILSYAAWASTPGTYPGPFFWWMTANSWTAWGLITIIYLAAFLAGIRPARWFGTRLLPVAAMGPLTIVVIWLSWLLERQAPFIGYLVFLVEMIFLVSLIQITAQARDFS